MTPPASKQTILVANRGEIACRIMRTAKALGYRVGAVYSDADADALHVRSADIAVRIGPAEVRASYLDISAIIAAARKAGAGLVHPGYGFLSENAEFASACRDAGLTFIGPTPEAIAAMGNKAAAKRRMLEAGVPCVPGFQGTNATDDVLIEQAKRIGFPLMVKAAAGGGGRGMRLVERDSDLSAALEAARSEAVRAFGSDELILERALQRARHVEVQVLADAHGHCIHLGERDCSVQRRHQKVIEEAPSPAVDDDLRARMGAAAVAAARAIGYRNAGTVEFLLADDGAFYFLEMNTRLQVEHPVTELVTGLDLVALQIAVAQGVPLPLTQDDVRITGHAIEARLYAEAPARGFLPQAGPVLAWAPPSSSNARVDHGITAGGQVSPDYDPMLAKIIAHGATREDARRQLAEALGDTVLLGIETNRTFLIACLEHPEFAGGNATTDFIASQSASLAAPKLPIEAIALGAVVLFEASARRFGHDPAQAWSSSGPIAWPMRFVVDENEEAPAVACTVQVAEGSYVVDVDGARVEIALPAVDVAAGALRWRSGGIEQAAHVAFDGDVLHLQGSRHALRLRDTLYAPVDAGAGRDSGELLAPMNGRIVGVFGAVGKTVEKGQRLVVLEAMKMQHEIKAAASGLIAHVAVREGDQVATRQLLVRIDPHEPR